MASSFLLDDGVDASELFVDGAGPCAESGELGGSLRIRGRDVHQRGADCRLLFPEAHRGGVDHFVVALKYVFFF